MSALLNQIVENAVERSESRESWSNIISTARPYNSNLNLEHQDYSDHYNTMSSEAEDNMLDAFDASNNQDRKLCHVPYSFKYEFFLLADFFLFEKWFHDFFALFFLDMTFSKMMVTQPQPTVMQCLKCLI